MKNQILEFISGSIENIETFGDPIEFFQANCAKLRVKLKFNGQLKVKLHQSEVKDQNKKGAHIQG